MRISPSFHRAESVVTNFLANIPGLKKGWYYRGTHESDPLIHHLDIKGLFSVAAFVL